MRSHQFEPGVARFAPTLCSGPGRGRPGSALAAACFGAVLLEAPLSRVFGQFGIAQAGIGRRFQKPTVFAQHTVFENLELSMAGDKSVWHGLFDELVQRHLTV